MINYSNRRGADFRNQDVFKTDEPSGPDGDYAQYFDVDESFGYLSDEREVNGTLGQGFSTMVMPEMGPVITRDEFVKMSATTAMPVSSGLPVKTTALNNNMINLKGVSAMYAHPLLRYVSKNNAMGDMFSDAWDKAVQDGKDALAALDRRRLEEQEKAAKAAIARAQLDLANAAAKAASDLLAKKDVQKVIADNAIEAGAKELVAAVKNPENQKKAMLYGGIGAAVLIGYMMMKKK